MKLHLFIGGMAALQVILMFQFFLLIVGMIVLPIALGVAAIFAHFGIYFLACRDVCAR